jgi:catechol 2,3-dioxygenase-like lactoylglutathione lyase family enzyme
MEKPISGIHRVTAIASNPQRNLDFYTDGLGLRLVKRANPPSITARGLSDSILSVIEETRSTSPRFRARSRDNEVVLLSP